MNNLVIPHDFGKTRMRNLLARRIKTRRNEADFDVIPKARHFDPIHPRRVSFIPLSILTFLVATSLLCKARNTKRFLRNKLRCYLLKPTFFAKAAHKYPRAYRVGNAVIHGLL